MECPVCRNTDFLPGSSFCQKCGARLSFVSVVSSSGRKDGGEAAIHLRSTAQRSVSGDCRYQGVDKGQFKGTFIIHDYI